MQNREDIEAAMALLDQKGQSSISGLGSPRQVRKALEKLTEFLPDEYVLALAVGSDPPPTMSEQRQLGAASSLGEISRTARSARLLTLTEVNLWEIQASGRLNGSRPRGIRIPLTEITDVRTLSERKLSRLGGKQSLLAIDFMRGPELETRLHEISGGERTLAIFASGLTAQVQTVSEELSAAASEPLASTADELAKLANLRDSGVLTTVEFEAEKRKLLERT